MAQVSRAIKRVFLQACSSRLRTELLNSHPNLRKAAPPGLCFVYPYYYSGIVVNIDTRYKVERIMWSGRYEPPLCAFLEARDTAGWVCLDIGANVGAIALVLAKRCAANPNSGNARPQGRVYAFEPGPPNLARLRENLKLNPELAARTEVIAAGVSDSAGELWWAEESANPGNALLSSTGTDRVPVITVDDFVRERSLDRIDLIKIDVEGMELKVMHGARNTLLRLRPILYFETLPRYTKSGTGASFQQMKQFLAGECGYALYRIASDGTLLPAGERGHGGYTVAVHASVASRS
jgi:FkbM family methyltransferase